LNVIGVKTVYMSSMLPWLQKVAADLALQWYTMLCTGKPYRPDRNRCGSHTNYYTRNTLCGKWS